MRSTKGATALRANKVVSIRDFLVRRGAAQASLCAQTRRVLSFVDTLPAGISPDEADAMIRAHIAVD
jgi:hypothetical protein